VNFKNITLGDICFIEKGKIGIKAAIPGEYALVTTAAERSSHNEYHFEGEAVCIPLVSATGHGHASIKRIHFEKGKFCLGNILCACMPKDYHRTSAKFLHLYFSLLKDVILVPLMQGSANVSLKLKDLEKVEIPDVSFERQLEIVDEFERLEVINKKLLTELNHQQTYLQLLRQTILQEAVQGKLSEPGLIRLKDDRIGGDKTILQSSNPINLSADEPATELLKRIKTEKGKLIKAGKLKKEKELPPITEDEIPFELPEGWVWCRLGEVIELISGQHVEAADWNNKEDGYPYLTGPSDFGVSSPIFSRWTRKPKVFAMKNDILITVKGSGVGKLNLLHEDNIAIGRQLMAVRVKYIERDLVTLFLDANYHTFQNDKAGIAIPGISRDDILDKVFPLPPLAEQQRIVAKVQQLQQQLSQLEDQVQQSRQYAQQLLQCVLKETFEEKGKVYKMKEEKVSLVAE